MNVIPWRDRTGLSSFRADLENLLDHFPWDDAGAHLPATFTRKAMPPADVAESEKNWMISVQLPGMNEKDIQVQLMGRQLLISGEKKWEEEKKGKEYRRVESQYGSFERSIQLPENVQVDPERITATYKRGVLEVVVPKMDPTPTAKISVKSG